MAEVDDFDVKKTSHIVIKDGDDEHKIVMEGTVTEFWELEGTNVTRIKLNNGHWIECTKVV